MVKRFEIYFVEFDPTKCSEISKTRPGVILSPDEMNEALNTVIIAPLTSTLKNYPSRVNCLVKNKKGQIALDQIRCVDKSRLKNKLAKLSENEQTEVLEILQEMFSK
ncbi:MULTISPECIES: type II toxin-antitoxin system PemK/MazF family toxin [unclassified Kaistella]|uniref:type II toxin-antitoxin system PemK/MazF family toxin n=1 Tax=unclassified Kaistella TaxID=2762626 RepID=UPI00273646B5|nr:MULTISPECIES: type II toxin-antitoxin system PemK/MazF family toxin [unclassified Kaistella]MDP2453150.1 type II toxin-antitoxin system PemK/MazF family toxin [Kaistella sp. SH11-4b]MDP2456207.1 type II toxin-antitoxin system PemK/MazF family toxin [Kaistella sp. SH40-3]MDP2458963.1 type II toxin-antitoxin system PemK/MazF family toxin [Kaistella sp. SH19-2b]